MIKVFGAPIEPQDSAVIVDYLDRPTAPVARLAADAVFAEIPDPGGACVRSRPLHRRLPRRRAADPTHKAAREVLARANSEPAAILAALGEPTQAGVTPLYHSDDADDPQCGLGQADDDHAARPPHVGGDRRLTGREDNIFWRRVPAATGGLIEAAGAKSLGERGAEPLGRDVIHSVTNPLGRLTAAIHVYGGDFYGAKPQRLGPRKPARTRLRFSRCTAACSRKPIRLDRSW